MDENKIRARARVIANAGNIKKAIEQGALSGVLDVSVSEAIVLGLLKQEVCKFFGILGHGNTDLGEILRIYSEEQVTLFIQCRNEVAMAHAATALSWCYGEVPAVLTSIGPGALQAMAGSLAAASNNVGVYHLYGDETTNGEGPNMQQLPGGRQLQFGRLTETMGASYTLHTPGALRDALRRGARKVFHPFSAGPFYLNLPINVQPKPVEMLKLESLPTRVCVPSIIPAGDSPYFTAINYIQQYARIVIKAGGGTKKFADQIRQLAEQINAVVVLSPGSLGVLPDQHPQNMHVGGSKGSISGNFAMEEAELVFVIGSRAVCQADCSGTGYPKAKAVININAELNDALHYNHTIVLAGDIGATIEQLLVRLRNTSLSLDKDRGEWLDICTAKKHEWAMFKAERCSGIQIEDPVWGEAVLTQPSAISIAAQFANKVGAIKLFDAGDVQANGFQIVEDDRPDQTITESGASYMGFAASALLSAGVADVPKYMIAFSGDGSFMMNPQILIDAVEYNVHGMLIIFDNRRMAAISSLQVAQYGSDFGTNDSVAVDYVALARAVKGIHAVYAGTTADSLYAALEDAYAYNGFSVVHVPVHWGHDNPLAGMGSYGRWNVGPWVKNMELLYAQQNI